MSKAEVTRSDILRRGLELIYKQGYQSTSIDDILATTKVTKGAFYYHFRNKEEMGVALISEAMQDEIWPHIEKSLSAGSDFRDNIYEMINGLLFEHPFMTVEHGCPAVNLIQEMAPLSEAFRTALIKSLNKWKRAIEAEIIRGQQAGQLGMAHDAKQIALNVITLYHGVRNMGKLLGKTYYTSFLNEFRRYLDTLE
ncbi:TetR/AcrR family transcriptional regulator [Pedobacter panaciterrae]|jgi:AcrR family transcriptional regulator|uniref:TetR/AcrR family transcriptional regulator n=1 Tax=Pedobacter panaciterrae TaxID=363849 RepID=A0ABU8NFK1_9SPHI|nr:TetR/AcrR family transcriptional regulator [Pedobacter panaciterrae]NQX56692.1 TetR/AcrR family transcriptional regulator [Pedobacter panaciterrae]